MLLLATCCFAGCTKTIEIRHYPTFYTPDLKSLAVLPFDNDTLNKQAGHYLADRLAKSLRVNGTYKIVGPRELASRVGSARLKELPPADKQAAAELIGNLGDAQAFIIGTVTTFTSAKYSYRWRYRGYGQYWYGHDPYYWRWRRPINYYTHNEGRVRARATLVRISDGSIVSETTMYAGGTVFAEGDPPYRTHDECLVEATRRAVDQLIGRFAIVRRRVRVRLDKALRTAGGRDGDKWIITDRFDLEGEPVTALVSLPPECTGNRFRLEVTESGRDETLLEEDFVWSDRQRERQIIIAPKRLGSSPAGRTFAITLYSEYERIVSRKITVK
ncbi:MAG: LPS assembly lipoprotein LptE [Phycisphaerae bacterium]|nr:LPS assembly lipoprotein LptE [Phycisphaerae bacterium]